MTQDISILIGKCIKKFWIYAEMDEVTCEFIAYLFLEQILLWCYKFVLVTVNWWF